MSHRALATLGMILLGACSGRQVADSHAPVAQQEPVAEVAPAAQEDVNASEAESQPEAESAVEAEAPLIAIDTHIDTTQRLLDDGDDPFDSLAGAHVDVPRMREGGLTGAFFSIFVNPERFPGAAGWERALALSRRVNEIAENHREEAILCRNASDVRRAAREGKVAILMGVEGAHALDTDDEELALARIRELYALGNRYMTITWSVDNSLGHSSSGDHPEGGLTELGRAAVGEMNRLGMIVDVSHVSDQTFSDVMDVTTRPVLASHSSARALSDHPRNMTDAMIRRVAENRGAVCVNYFNNFIDADYHRRRRRVNREHRARFRALRRDHPNWVERGAAAFALAQELEPELNPPTLETLANHFEHVAQVGGTQTPCLGSDFDGVTELPLGMEGVQDLPRLRETLEARGLPIRAIFGENVLRVLAAQGGDGEQSPPQP